MPEEISLFAKKTFSHLPAACCSVPHWENGSWHLYETKSQILSELFLRKNKVKHTWNGRKRKTSVMCLQREASFFFRMQAIGETRRAAAYKYIRQRRFAVMYLLQPAGLDPTCDILLKDLKRTRGCVLVNSKKRKKKNEEHCIDLCWITEASAYCNVSVLPGLLEITMDWLSLIFILFCLFILMFCTCLFSFFVTKIFLFFFTLSSFV